MSAQTRCRAANRPPARWTLLPTDENAVRNLSQALGLHPAVARVLIGRGLSDPEESRAFLSPLLKSLRDPFELRDMRPGVERALRAIRSGESIAVFGDYDVDGVSSTAIMVLALRHLGADPRIFIPHRIDDGYGMNARAIEELAEAGVRLIITVDTGVTATEEISRATELGLDVVVTDHHLAEGELPPAQAVINPNVGSEIYAHGRLCGAGVAFKFAHALLKDSGRPQSECIEFLKGLLDIVALGTIADIVPLTGENRVLARFGLDVLTNSERPGLRALLEETKLEGKPITSEHVGFLLGPRLNAAGRTDHANIALDLLLSGDIDEARAIARQLSDLNRERRSTENGILKDSLDQAESQMESGEEHFLVVGGPEYHLGVVGIVAARLVEKFHRPSIVLRVDPELAKGSARSIPGFDLHNALGACDSHLIGFGGHAAAAGVRLEPAAVDPFRTAINDFARELFEERDMSPEIAVDAEVSGDEIDWNFYRHLQNLQPFGCDNANPVFLLSGATPAAAPRIVGRDHLQLSLRAGNQFFRCIGFGLGSRLPLCDTSSPIDVLFRPVENHFRGRTTLELQLVDVRPAQ